MIRKIITTYILKNFLQIDLNGVEKEIAEKSIVGRYAPSMKEGLWNGLLIIPAILVLDTAVLISILIPITMVTGTAWFAISLATIRKKFEDFGMELCTSMYKSFISSLVVLGLLAFYSLIADMVQPAIAGLQDSAFLIAVAVVFGTATVFRILWNLFVGSMKYDINDAMLTGQHEAAEKYYKKSLSLLHASAENLRTGKDLAVANYYLGLSLYDIALFIAESDPENTIAESMIQDAHRLKSFPEIDQEEADQICVRLIDNFLDLCHNIEGHKSEKSFRMIQDEMEILKNRREDQKIVDTRLALIFDEIVELMESQGESLFVRATT